MIALKFLFYVMAAFGQNKMHPTFPVPGPAANEPGAIAKACGACHNLEPIIEKKTSHSKHDLQINCLDCHLPSQLRKQKVPLDNKGWALASWVENIKRPSTENCLNCHGNPSQELSDSEVGSVVGLAVEDLEPTSKAVQFWSSHLMQTQGMFFLAQKISESFLNIENKNLGNLTWDVHAQRQMNCTSCHSAKNNPAQNHLATAELKHLKFDVREELALNDYLKNPDHHLKSAKCSNCHDPLSAHANFPYRSRHLESLSCQACHIPEVTAPILKQVDMSLFTSEGSPLFEYWNTEFKIPTQDGKLAAINTQLVKRHTPILLSKNNKIWPYNIIQVRRWLLDKKAQPKGEKVKAAQLEVFLTAEQFKEFFWKDDKVRGALSKILDLNHNNIIDPDEWQTPNLDRDTFIKSILANKGFPQAQLVESKAYFRLTHGVRPARTAILSCQECHGNNSRFDVQTKKYGLALLSSTRPNDPAPPKIDNYVLGTTQNASIDWLGKIGVLLLVIFIFLHAGLRWYSSRRRLASGGTHNQGHNQQDNLTVNNLNVQIAKTTIYLYGRYERFWHWMLAFSTSGLLLTGLEIHYPNSLSLFGFRNAVLLHNGAAFLFILNSGLSLFYHITNSKIRQFIPVKNNFWPRIKEQILYYSHGIFKGPIQHEKSGDSKFNPLQQITYLALLNILLPLQMLTGFLMWAVDKSDPISQALHSYTYLGPLHTAGSWLFCLFLILHVYLTTTGETPLAHIKSMITGEDHKIEDNQVEEINRGTT